MITETARDAITHVLEPLCSSTAELVSGIDLYPNDRLEIGTNTQDPTHFVIQAYAMIGETRVSPSKIAALDFWLRLEERKELGYGRWSIAATDFNVMIINAVWDSHRITFKDDHAKTMWTFLLMRFMDQAQNATHFARFKHDGTLPDRPMHWIDHPTFPLAGYQKCAAYVGSQTDGLALFMEQGTGKTPTTIAMIMQQALEKILSTGTMYRGIIVCPKNVKTNWMREIHKFATLPGKVVVLRGGVLHRVKQLIEVAEADKDCAYAIVICSYETISRTWDAIKKFNWDVGIADESDMFKSPWAKRAQWMMKLRDICERRYALTGTPVNNTILDLYYQLEWLGEGMSGFNSWKRFRSYYNKYAEVSEESGNYQGAKVLVGMQNLPILHERLARVSFRITKKEAMPELPDKLDPDVIECSMTKEQARVYASVARELAAQIDSVQEGASRMTVNNVLTKLLRLNQITAGYAVIDSQYDDDGNAITTGDDRIKWFDESPKIEELISMLKSKSPDDKTIVWSCWKPLIRRIKERLDHEGIKSVVYHGDVSDADREIAERSFNTDPSVKVFIGNPGAGGVGMNLPGYDASCEEEYTTNANHTIYIASDWSWRKRSQSSDRNHGRGRCRMPIRYTDIIIPGTIDVEILDTLNTKKETALEAGDVRAILSRLLSFDPSESED